MRYYLGTLFIFALFLPPFLSFPSNVVETCIVDGKQNKCPELQDRDSAIRTKQRKFLKRFESASFTFALVTDTHVGTKTGEEDLRRTVSDINSLNDIAFVLVSGDVTEFGSDEEIITAKRLLDGLKVPYYVVPGNHDSNWSESGNNTFLQVFGSETFRFDYGGYLFIGLASGPNMRMGPGQIPRENLTWFFEQLRTVDKKQPLIFVNHYPMDAGLNNWFEVMDALRPFNVKMILCGHGHQDREYAFEGIKAAMCRSNLRAEADYGGYNIITIDGDSIIFRERLCNGKTLAPWLSYTLADMPDWEKYPSRPDFSMNKNNPFVEQIWRKQEKSDIGSGMCLEDNKLVYANTNGEIKCVEASSGDLNWSYKTGGKIYSTPTIYKGTVWCASSDSYLYGLNFSDGKLLHRLKNEKAVVSSPVCADNKVIVAGSDGHCRAWNVVSGELLWDYGDVKNFVVTRLQIKDGSVYFGSWGNQFYALDIVTGKPRWIWNSGHNNRMLSPAQVVPVFAHGRVYLASPDRYMTVLAEQTGRVIWRHKDSELRARESIGISEDGNTIYAKTMDGQLIALDATTAERVVKWVSTGEDMGYELAPTPVVEKNGVVYAPTDKGLIYAYRASDGAFLWKYRVSFGLINMILPADRGEVYVSAMDGRLVKLKVSNL